MDPDELAALRKARSLLTILLATCRETSLALQAVGNVLDTDLGRVLDAMIERSESELGELTAKIDAASV